MKGFAAEAQVVSRTDWKWATSRRFEDRKSLVRLVVSLAAAVSRWVFTGIHGEELDPDEISRLLSCAPTSAHRRGDSRPSGPPWPNGAWLLSVDGKSPTGPEELVHLLLAIFPTDASLWSEIRSRFRIQLSFEIFAERWNRGFELSSEAVARIRSLSAGVGFDIYANLEEGDDG